MAITRDMTIDTMFSTFPEKSQKLAQEMTNAGLHCVGCSAATYETLEMGMLGHGFTDEAITELLSRLNHILSEELDTTTISLTERAAKKFAQVAEAEGHASPALRFGLKPGGCNGFEYILDFAKESTPQDETFTSHGVEIYVDKEQVPQLMGCEIDFLDGLNGSGFKISNPNARSSCSCGNSQAY